MPNDETPMDRRRFFRRGLAQLIKPIASALSPLERAAKQIGTWDASLGQTGRRVPLNVWLRPPGALAEKDFLDACSRCGKCAEICPAHCIKIDATGLHGAGAPFIDANASACVVCSGLYCMQVCPTGALVKTALTDIDMGTAVWQEDTCLRTTGGDCRICVDECPLGEMAIKLKGREVAVQPLGCIGCGICQQYCPTNPKSVVVIPIVAKRA
jgi:ferredoxin-type protein NapG